MASRVDEEAMNVSDHSANAGGLIRIPSRTCVQGNRNFGNFPEDTYSFIALNGPQRNQAWTRDRILFFLFGFLPFIFQMVFFGLLLFSETNELRGTIGETDNPTTGSGPMAFFASFFPANSTPIIRVTQVTTMAAYLIFPDAGLQDIMLSIRTLPSKRASGQPFWCMVLSSVLRFIQAVASTSVMMLLVLTSTEVVDIILNFTAVNFISRLDEYAFELAKSGEFSPDFQVEAERIANTALPQNMIVDRDSKWKCNRTVAGLVFVILTAMIAFVFASQDSPAEWLTNTLRVQLQDPELNEYSGCFRVNTSSSSMSFSRRAYHSNVTGPAKATFGYCRRDRRWVLFKGNATDPCEAGDRNDLALAISSKTDSFDISTVFDEGWVSASNTPLDLYFFDGGNETEIEEHCGSSLDDGHCDPFFNVGGYQYDGGDCCASTCTQPNCGFGGLTSVFEQSSVSGDGFENCVDPNMHPITIRLNDITSSRMAAFYAELDNIDLENLNLDFMKPVLEDLNGWDTFVKVEPVKPYFALDCDGKNVMKAYIDSSMKHKSHTVMVEDGAACTLVTRTSDDPIWLLDFTIFHGDSDEGVEILTANNFESDTFEFSRIPECFFRKLKDYTDLDSIYTGSRYSNQAIDWLLEDDSGNSRCEDPRFLERYALVSMNFAMEKEEIDNAKSFLESEDQCRWPTVVCSQGSVATILMQDAGLRGPIPSELKLLSSLESLQVSCDQAESLSEEVFAETLRRIDMSASTRPCSNFPVLDQIESLDFRSSGLQKLPENITLFERLTHLIISENSLTSLPSSIGDLTNLQTLSLEYNKLTSLPSSLGELTSLQTLNLDNNRLQSLPSSIGNLQSLQDLDVSFNLLASLPSSIGGLTSLQTLYLEDNALTSLPSSIGDLARVYYLDLAYNKLTSLPSSIGALTRVGHLDLEDNALTSVPASIGELQSLIILNLGSNLLTSIPSSIGNLQSLGELRLNFNALTSLPSSIGELQSLGHLNVTENKLISLPSSIGGWGNIRIMDVSNNTLTSLPSSIGDLASLTILLLDNNSLQSLPPSIGNLQNLGQLYLNNNALTSLPSSIGNLQSLLFLDLKHNELLSLPSSFGDLASLMVLFLEYNNLTSLPSSIGDLPSLFSLNLNYNNLTSLPSSIGNVKSLGQLLLNHNNLISLPSSIGDLSNLATLELDHNNLTSLPSSIGDLSNLATLFLEYNNLTSLPPSIGDLSNLIALFLEDNNLTFLPPSIGDLTNLLYLGFDSNALTSVPSWIGDLTNLLYLNFEDNALTSVPSSIGDLTSLQYLYFADNSLTSLPLSIGDLTGLLKLELDGNPFSCTDDKLANLCGPASCWNVCYDEEFKVRSLRIEIESE